MSTELRFLTDEQGQRIGVVLEWDAYLQLTNQAADPDFLTNLSQPELQALAESTLAAKEQDRLQDLLARNAEGQLSEEESTELDRLVAQIDQLNTLKARARYTLAHYNELVTTP